MLSNSKKILPRSIQKTNEINELQQIWEKSNKEEVAYFLALKLKPEYSDSKSYRTAVNRAMEESYQHTLLQLGLSRVEEDDMYDLIRKKGKIKVKNYKRRPLF